MTSESRMRCEYAASIARDLSKRLDAIYPPDTRTEAAGTLERHYRRECGCYRITDDTIGLRKPAHIDWDLFDGS